jgi:hypothetical protein
MAFRREKLVKHRAYSSKTALLLLEIILKEEVAYCPSIGWENIINQVSR